MRICSLLKVMVQPSQAVQCNKTKPTYQAEYHLHQEESGSLLTEEERMFSSLGFVMLPPSAVYPCSMLLKVGFHTHEEIETL